jgi:hypothetical protein
MTQNDKRIGSALKSLAQQRLASELSQKGRPHDLAMLILK